MITNIENTKIAKTIASTKRAADRKALTKIVTNTKLSSSAASAALTSLGCPVAPRTVREYRQFAGLSA